MKKTAGIGMTHSKDANEMNQRKTEAVARQHYYETRSHYNRRMNARGGSKTRMNSELAAITRLHFARAVGMKHAETKTGNVQHAQMAN